MKLRLIASILILAVSGGATTIVAVKTNKEIVISADSKVTDTFGNAKPTVGCKIVTAGGVVFAYAGFARDTETGFDVPKIVAAALTKNSAKTIAEKAEAVGRTVVERLETEIPTLKASSFVTYREKIEGKTFLRILIAGFEKKKPVLLVRLFRFGQLADGSAGVIVSNDDCDAGCKVANATRFLGETGAIDGLPEETRDFWKQGLAVGVRKLIEIQIAARDEYVGPPVDIVSVTAKRVRWIEKKQGCDR